MTKPMVIIEPAGMKNQDGGEIWHIRLGFETVSWQLVAHIQKIFYSIHAKPFSRKPKSSKQKKGSASRVLARTVSVQCSFPRSSARNSQVRFEVRHLIDSLIS